MFLFGDYFQVWIWYTIKYLQQNGVWSSVAQSNELFQAFRQHISGIKSLLVLLGFLCFLVKNKINTVSFVCSSTVLPSACSSTLLQLCWEIEIDSFIIYHTLIFCDIAQETSAVKRFQPSQQHSEPFQDCQKRNV